MLASRDPKEAYRRVDIDARVEGATPAELVGVCYDQFVLALGSAIQAAERKDNTAKSRWLTRALSALFALELGVSKDAPMAGALLQLYHSARNPHRNPGGSGLTHRQSPPRSIQRQIRGCGDLS